ncbi:MAG TPA: VanZ family protein [Candidatus Binatia bacterium]|nr:VanZ family protein [Candidatus Binatia bacterium]
MNHSDSEDKTALYLLWAYCVFILYGCFIPFHFNFDPNFVRWRWVVFVTESLHEDIARPSLSDIVSNILLFVPFGILSVWARRADRTDRAGFLAILSTTVYGLLFAIIIESGQTVAPGRDPSIRDAACNGFGAFIGAVCATVFIRDYRKYLQSEFIRVLFRTPSLLLLAYLICGILLDSYFPFEVTLDVSSVWHNLKNSQILPFRSTSDAYWLNLWVDKGIPYGVIAYLFLTNLRPSSRLLTVGLAWLLTIVMACAIELGKLFFAGRAFYSDNVAIASVGALLGVLLLPRFCAVASVKRHREAIWFMLFLGFLVYFELSPFDWVAPSELRGRFSAIEWLPFKSYYYGEPIAALFDLQKKVYSFIPFGFFAAGFVSAHAPGRSRQKTASLCFLVAAGLELFQIGLRSRIPSTGDVIIFSLSAWAGTVLFDLINSVQR